MGLGIGRLVSALQRLWGSDVGVLGDDRLITAVTEADLPHLDEVDLSVVVDADAMIFGPNYRAAEDAVRTMARVAGLARERTLIQVLSPSAPGIQALREGDAEAFIRAELVDRKALGFPPCGAIIVVEVRDGPPDTERRMAEVGSNQVHVFGPHDSADGARWLIQGADLRHAKTKLREVADWLRRQGAKLRIDVDPLDL
jgi:primosomal protein N' (replication factor Y)